MDYPALHKAVTTYARLRAADWGRWQVASPDDPWEYDYRYDDFVDRTADQRPRSDP